MASNRKLIHPPSLTRNAYFVDRSSINRSTPQGFRSPLRSRISDPRFDSTRSKLKSASRFPKLCPSAGANKMINGVVSLNTACERKYRPWRKYTWDGNVSRKTETFYGDLSTMHGCLPRLAGEGRIATRDMLKERSFCDTISSFPCSISSTQSSFCSVDIPVDREVPFISKHNAVLNWFKSIETASFNVKE